MNWGNSSNKALLYCSSLATAILVSYQGNKLVILFSKLMSMSVTNKESGQVTQNLALLFNQYLDFRRRCYEISIGLYFLSVIEKLSNVDPLTFPIWLSYKTVAFEILLSFVAIDTYVRNYVMNDINKESQ
jgi:hypothetical protein